MPVSVGPRTLKRAPAYYELFSEEYRERVKPLQEELREKVCYYFGEEGKNLIGGGNNV